MARGIWRIPRPLWDKVRGVVKILSHHRAYNRGMVAFKEEGKVKEAAMGLPMGRSNGYGNLYEQSLFFILLPWGMVKGIAVQNTHHGEW